ncbi:hypothetical protein SIM20_23935 [Bacillus cereus group sp. BfR-BA-02570]|uniref:hypothetical protein n=1 Tax=Bacillus cereus group sp. BfR-BA-02570 TaxID=3094890 RepID=UPI0029C54EC6|nr:hypothetical protein [Bacillus cereus group sp. BfR-BA-02570]MDX5746184.1 hypothetical protein [Bacillus cereus group sp. BfR-BA-02570]
MQSGKEFELKKFLIGILLLCLIGTGLFYLLNPEKKEITSTYSDTKQKQVIEYNEKKKNELLTEKFELLITDMLIEPISDTEWEYYKVTTNTGIYKIAFAYDSNDKIIGFKEFKQITSIN